MLLRAPIEVVYRSLSADERRRRLFYDGGGGKAVRRNDDKSFAIGMADERPIRHGYDGPQQPTGPSLLHIHVASTKARILLGLPFLTCVLQKPHATS